MPPIAGSPATTASVTPNEVIESLDGTLGVQILFLVIDQIYDKDVIDRKRLGDLLNGTPQPGLVFIRGFECAGKIQVYARVVR